MRNIQHLYKALPENIRTSIEAVLMFIFMMILGFIMQKIKIASISEADKQKHNEYLEKNCELIGATKNGRKDYLCRNDDWL